MTSTQGLAEEIGARDWRSFCTLRESVEVEGLEKNQRLLAERREGVSRELAKIRSRCITRRYEAMLRAQRQGAA